MHLCLKNSGNKSQSSRVFGYLDSTQIESTVTQFSGNREKWGICNRQWCWCLCVMPACWWHKLSRGGNTHMLGCFCGGFTEWKRNFKQHIAGYSQDHIPHIPLVLIFWKTLWIRKVKRGGIWRRAKAHSTVSGGCIYAYRTRHTGRCSRSTGRSPWGASTRWRWRWPPRSRHSTATNAFSNHPGGSSTKTPDGGVGKLWVVRKALTATHSHCKSSRSGSGVGRGRPPPCSTEPPGRTRMTRGSRSKFRPRTDKALGNGSWVKPNMLVFHYDFCGWFKLKKGTIGQKLCIGRWLDTCNGVAGFTAAELSPLFLGTAVTLRFFFTSPAIDSGELESSWGFTKYCDAMGLQHWACKCFSTVAVSPNGGMTNVGELRMCMTFGGRSTQRWRVGTRHGCKKAVKYKKIDWKLLAVWIPPSRCGHKTRHFQKRGGGDRNIPPPSPFWGFGDLTLRDSPFVTTFLNENKEKKDPKKRSGPSCLGHGGDTGGGHSGETPKPYLTPPMQEHPHNLS